MIEIYYNKSGILFLFQKEKIKQWGTTQMKKDAYFRIQTHIMS